MKVLRQRKTWREQNQRMTVWVPLAKAAQLVEEPELSRLISAFGEVFVGVG